MDVNTYRTPDPVGSPTEEEQEAPIPFISPRFLGLCACLGLALNVATALFALFLQGGQWGASAARTDFELFMEQVDLALWVDAADFGLLLLRLLTAPFFIAWTYRVHRNLLALGHRNLDWKPVAGLMVWFIPLFGLVLPWLVIREIAWRSDPRAEELGKGNRLLIAVNWWWGLFLVGPLLFLLQLFVPTLLESLPSDTWFRLYVTMLVSVVVSGTLACWLVLHINGLQSLRLRQIQSGGIFIEDETLAAD